jgi:hypothetical protein
VEIGVDKLESGVKNESGVESGVKKESSLETILLPICPVPKHMAVLCHSPWRLCHATTTVPMYRTDGQLCSALHDFFLFIKSHCCISNLRRRG